MAGNPLLALAVETPDVAGSFAAGQAQAQTQKTARLSGLIEQFKLDSAQREAEKSNKLAQFYQQNGAGIAAGDTTSLGALAAIDPAAAIETKGKLQTQTSAKQTADDTHAAAQFKQAHEQLDFIGAQAQSIMNSPAEFRPMLYSRAIAQAKAMGIDTSNVPQDYSEATVQQMASQALSAKDQLDQHQKQLDFAEKQRLASPEYLKQKAAAEAEGKLPSELKLQEQRSADAIALEKIKGNETGGASAELTATDPDSGSILAQTGLSMPAFLALTGKAASLPRDKATRDAAFKQAADFANKRGVDVSTLTSQYQAYNETLNANIKRVNQTRIMEGELQGTLDNLKPVSDAAGLGTLRLANVAKVWAGQETNDPIVEQYAFQLNQLRSELAAYNGALQGRSGASLTQQDYGEAERVIKGGLSSKAADGLRTAVSSATEKMSGVLNKNVDTARKSVWDLFGVGANYKPQHGGEATGTLPPGVTEEDIQHTLKLHPETTREQLLQKLGGE